MALVPCKECGHQVSKTAAACPSCGAAVRATSPARFGLAVIAAMGFGVIAALVAITVFVISGQDSTTTAGLIAFAVGAVAGWYRVMR